MAEMTPEERATQVILRNGMYGVADEMFDDEVERFAAAIREAVAAERAKWAEEADARANDARELIHGARGEDIARFGATARALAEFAAAIRTGEK